MVSSEVPKPYREFNYPHDNFFERELVERLKPPTKLGADLHLAVGPQLWYGQVFRGSFNNAAAWESFRVEYLRRSLENSAIRDPHTIIDQNWQPISIASLPKVSELLNELGDQVSLVANWLNRNARNESDRIFARYLDIQAELLPEGKFNDAMMSWLKLPPELPIGWVVLPVESHIDPNKEKTSFEGLLTYTDREATRGANDNIAKFKRASIDKYGYAPIDAKVVVAHAAMFSGFLQELDDGKGPSAFNVPNDPEIAEAAGNNLIYLFMGRMLEKNNKEFSPKLNEWFGLQSNVWDIIYYTEGHEYAHGFRYEGEENRWGKWRVIGRELWAADRAVVLASTDHFSGYFLRRVLRGNLAYACVDVKHFTPRLFDSYGVNQPTIEQLYRETSDYGFGSYIIQRQAVNANFLGRSHLDIDGLVRLSEERDKQLEKIARSGSEEEAEKYLTSLIDEERIFPVDADVSLNNPSTRPVPA